MMARVKATYFQNYCVQLYNHTKLNIYFFYLLLEKQIKANNGKCKDKKRTKKCKKLEKKCKKNKKMLSELLRSFNYDAPLGTDDDKYLHDEADITLVSHVLDAAVSGQ